MTILFSLVFFLLYHLLFHIAILGALHNLSYYHGESTEILSYKNNIPGSLIEKIKEICVILSGILNNNNANNLVKIESLKVLGNMTRSSDARNCSVSNCKVLITLLESTDDDLIIAVCGVLINLLADWERRRPFKELHGHVQLIKILNRYKTRLT